MVGYLDPVTLVSAMAAVTKSVAFGITGSISYISMYLGIQEQTKANECSIFHTRKDLVVAGPHHLRKNCLECSD